MDNSLIVKEASSLGVTEEQLKQILKLTVGLVGTDDKTLLCEPFSFDKEIIAPVERQATYLMILDFLKYKHFRNNGTETTYRRQLESLFNYLKLNNIDRPKKESIEGYISSLMEEGKSDTTQQNNLTATKLFFSYLEEVGRYPNIAKTVKNVEIDKLVDRHHSIDKYQLERVRKNIGNTTLKQKRNYAIVTCMAYMGLRAVEVSRATREDFKQGVFVAHGKGRGQKGKTRYCEVYPLVDEAVRDYISAREKAEGKKILSEEPLFVGVGKYKTNEPMLPKSICRIVKNAFNDVGLSEKGISSHSLRKTFNTVGYNVGVDIFELQRADGHANVSTTEKYIDSAKAKHNEAFRMVGDELSKACKKRSVKA